MGNNHLSLIPPKFIDHAWKDGANSLSEACSDECTIDQLKLVLSRGERQLVRLDRDGKSVGWAVYKIEQYPNLHIFHITNLVAHNAHFELFYGELTKLAETFGCSRIRCCAKPAQARLYSMKLGFKPVYTTLEVEV